MTSGNIAVFDHDAWRFTDFVVEFNRLFDIDQEHTEAVKERVQELPATRRSRASPTREDLLKIKGLIRTTEARAAAAGLRHPAGATRVHGPALLPHRHHRQGPDPSAGHRRHRRPAANGCSRRRSTWPANCPTRTARTASAPRRSSRRCAQVRSQGPDVRGLAVSRRLGGMGAARDRARGAAQPGRPGAQEAGDLPPSVAEGPGHVPRRHRPPRVLAARRGPQPRHGQASTTRSGCRSSTPWKASCSGAVRFAPPSPRTGGEGPPAVQSTGRFSVGSPASPCGQS